MAALLKKPEAELKQIPGDSHQFFKFSQRETWLAWRREALAVKQAQDLLPLELLLVDRLNGVRGRFESLLRHTAGSAALLCIVGGAFLRIAKDLIGFGYFAKRLGISLLTIVGMKPLRLNTIHAMNGLLIGVRADLKDLVVIHASIIGCGVRSVNKVCTLDTGKRNSHARGC